MSWTLNGKLLSAATSLATEDGKIDKGFYLLCDKGTSNHQGPHPSLDRGLPCGLASVVSLLCCTNTTFRGVIRCVRA